MDKELKVIGSNTMIDLVGHVKGVPAKIDTGADSSAIWATDVQVDPKGELSFVLFDKTSEYYTGEVIKSKVYMVANVKSSSGHDQIRYRTELVARVGGKRIKVPFNLSDRSSQRFPILIGRRTLTDKFLVDVSEQEVPRVAREMQKSLNEEMNKDPYKFYKKYHKQINKKEAL